jgi:transposase InsO family protein
MAHFIPCLTHTSAVILAQLFLYHIYPLHGLPKEIISDRGSQFISKFWNAFTNQLGIQVKLSTAFHPQTDGQTERVNQILAQYLRVSINYNQNDWCDLLTLAEFAYNNAQNASTKQSLPSMHLNLDDV